MWYQRSRTKWFVDGDQNAKFYHLQTITRRKRNRIIMLKNDSGEWITDQAALKSHVTTFYKEIFARPQNWCNWKQTDISFPVLSTENLAQMEKDINIEEVRAAYFLMKPWKVPDLDGFPAGFFQKARDVVGKGLSVLFRILGKTLVA